MVSYFTLRIANMQILDIENWSTASTSMADAEAWNSQDPK